MPHYKIIQTIYTAEPFPVLRDRVSNYFANRYFVVGEDHEDSLKDDPLVARWKRDMDDWGARCYATVYASRIHYSYIGSGTLIILNNNRRSQATRLGVPETARKMFPDTPNSISIDSHDYWSRESGWLAEELARLLSSNGQHPVMLSLDDRVTAVKSNPYLSDDERILALDAVAEEFLPPTTGLASLRQSLEALIGTPSWQGLSENARTFLMNGYIAFDRLDGHSTVVMESSGAAIQLSKALEDTVVRRLMTPFRDFLVASGTVIPPSTDRRLDRLRTYSQSSSDKKLELGTFATQLEFLDTPDTSSLPPTAAQYLSFLATLADPDFLQYELAHELLHVTRTYRNAAAHPELLDFSQLHAYLRLLIGEGPDEGLLPRLLSASAPANAAAPNCGP